MPDRMVPPMAFFHVVPVTGAEVGGNDNGAAVGKAVQKANQKVA